MLIFLNLTFTNKFGFAFNKSCCMLNAVCVFEDLWEESIERT